MDNKHECDVDTSARFLPVCATTKQAVPATQPIIKLEGDDSRTLTWHDELEHEDGIYSTKERKRSIQAKPNTPPQAHKNPKTPVTIKTSPAKQDVPATRPIIKLDDNDSRTLKWRNELERNNDFYPTKKIKQRIGGVIHLPIHARILKHRNPLQSSHLGK